MFYSSKVLVYDRYKNLFIEYIITALAYPHIKLHFYILFSRNSAQAQTLALAAASSANSSKYSAQAPASSANSSKTSAEPTTLALAAASSANSSRNSAEPTTLAHAAATSANSSKYSTQAPAPSADSSKITS